MQVLFPSSLRRRSRCSCGADSKERKRSGTGGLTSQHLLLVPLRGPNVGGQCSSCRFASSPPARGPRTIPFPHTSPHRSSSGLPPPLWPASPSMPAWLPSCCGGRVATKSPGKRGFPPFYRGGRPPSSHPSRRSSLLFEHSFLCHFERSREIFSVIPRLVRGICLPVLREPIVATAVQARKCGNGAAPGA